MYILLCVAEISSFECLKPYLTRIVRSLCGFPLGRMSSLLITFFSVAQHETTVTKRNSKLKHAPIQTDVRSHFRQELFRFYVVFVRKSRLYSTLSLSLVVVVIFKCVNSTR